LQTLTETKDRFHLNVKLPIPFDGWSAMEVDFLCADSRVVIELDGPHHFADLEAYRRDRRKDTLLQQNRYLILRFLAEDVGSRLDHVLDTVLSTLSNRQAVATVFMESKIVNQTTDHVVESYTTNAENWRSI
jgi:hypothetical protein